MISKEMTCIICPRGCRLKVHFKEGEYQVEGNFCKRGMEYGINEVKNPKRMVTSTVKIKGGIYKRLPVMTDKEIEKDKIFLVMDEINKVCVKTPIQYGDIIIAHILNTDVNIIASRSMKVI